MEAGTENKNNELESPHDVNTIFLNNLENAGLDQVSVLESGEEEEKKKDINSQEEPKPEEGEENKLKEGEEEEGEEEEGEEGEEENTLSEEEVETKLNELSEKEESDLTDDDKKFIEDNTPSSNLETFYKELGSPESVDLKNYDDTLEGVAKLNSDVNSLKSVELAKDLVSKTFKQNPALNKLYTHLNEGKPLETFLLENQKTEHSDIDLSKEEGQRSMVNFYYNKLGNSPDEIEDIISGLENRGKLEDKSKELKGLLDTQREAEITEKNKLAKEESIKLQEDNKKYIQEVKDTIASRKLADITLTNSQAKDFQDKIFSDDNYINDIYKSLPTDKLLLIDYLTILVNEGRLNEITKTTSTSKTNKKLGDMFAQNQKRTSLSNKLKGGKKDTVGDNLEELNNINIKDLINSN